MAGYFTQKNIFCGNVLKLTQISNSRQSLLRQYIVHNYLD